MEPFVAIDFETANGKRASACSIGLAKFDSQGALADTFHSFIQPHGDHRFFHPANTWVHGIQPTDVEGAPEWNQVSDQIAAFIEDAPLVAHNFGFDGSVLNQLTELYQLAPLENSRFCTMRLSRRKYPDLPQASLDVVFDHLFPGDVLHHHHAEADAVASGRIFAQMQQESSINELADLLAPTRRRRSANTALTDNAQNVAQLVETFGSSTVLKGQTVSFTGTLTRGKRADLETFLGHVGAAAAKSVTKETTLLVVGVPNPSVWRPGSSASCKIEKASELREKGSPIQVLSEEDFFALLEE